MLCDSFVVLQFKDLIILAKFSTQAVKFSAKFLEVNLLQILKAVLNNNINIRIDIRFCIKKLVH